MNFPFYIAKRYLFSKKSHNAINVISAISVCGVALATLALVCTLSVFNGFQDLVTTFFTAFDPELKITAVTGKVFDGQEARIEALRRMPEIAVFSESLEENAMVQYKGRQTGTVVARVVFPNESRLLHSGASGTVVVPTTYKNCIVIPQEATVQLQDKTVVYKVVDGKAVSALITVAGINDGREYVVLDGLEVGDEIVSTGAGLLREGTQVK